MVCDYIAGMSDQYVVQDVYKRQAYTIPQGQYPTDYWNDAISLGDDVIADKYDNMSDDELMKVLEDFQACLLYTSRCV